MSINPVANYLLKKVDRIHRSSNKTLIKPKWVWEAQIKLKQKKSWIKIGASNKGKFWKRNVEMEK